jgi:hypothetical protein
MRIPRIVVALALLSGACNAILDNPESYLLPDASAGGHAGSAGAALADAKAGLGANDKACPLNKPADSASCTERYRSCTWGGESCSCNGVSVGARRDGGTLSFVCSTGECPPAEPIQGSSCLDLSARCTYVGTVCTCQDPVGPAGPQWTCGNPDGGSCPATPPTEGASCTGIVRCTYPDLYCMCAGVGVDAHTWTCTAG